MGRLSLFFAVFCPYRFRLTIHMTVKYEYSIAAYIVV